MSLAFFQQDPTVLECDRCQVPRILDRECWETGKLVLLLGLGRKAWEKETSVYKVSRMQAPPSIPGVSGRISAQLEVKGKGTEGATHVG